MKWFKFGAFLFIFQQFFKILVEFAVKCSQGLLNILSVILRADARNHFLSLHNFLAERSSGETRSQQASWQQ